MFLNNLEVFQKSTSYFMSSRPCHHLGR